MSKNISKLSGRIGLKDNLFQKLSERSLNSKNGEGMKEIADKYHVGVSTLHGAESFYEFLRPKTIFLPFFLGMIFCFISICTCTIDA